MFEVTETEIDISKYQKEYENNIKDIQDLKGLIKELKYVKDVPDVIKTIIDGQILEYEGQIEYLLSANMGLEKWL